VLASVSTQLEPHWVSEPQPSAQAESRQTSPAAHDVAQSPQCAGSEVMSAQMPPHETSGAEQSHCPPEQAEPVGHALSQAPQ
jgi:hypothetical protein